MSTKTECPLNEHDHLNQCPGHSQEQPPVQQPESSVAGGGGGSGGKLKECEGPISVARILQSIQSQAESQSPDHSLREIDGATFLMAEGSRRLSIGARILLVEDNITNQKVAVRMLTRLGHRCDIAENGLQVHIPYSLIN
jgi:hypothetical protein